MRMRSELLVAVVLVAIGVLGIGALAQDTVSSGEKHRESWEALVEAAGDGGYAKYALYASRSLAVAHPEIYLVGDGWFYQAASSLKGFDACYRETDVLSSMLSEYGMLFRGLAPGRDGLSGGEVLNFAGIDLHGYQLTAPDQVIPGPYEPFVDHRLGPLAVTLKTEGRVVTELELAEIAYFQAIARGVEENELFLVACVDGGGYLLEGERLISMTSGTDVDVPTQSPYLIFNAESVWYPLMERDDSATNPALERAVKRLATPAGTPELSAWEAELVGSLRTTTELATAEQQDMAAIAATRTTAWRCYPSYETWLQFVPDSDFQASYSMRVCVVREFDRLANTVSPAAAYLYEYLVREGTLEERVRCFCDEYLNRVGVVREARKGWKPAGRLEAWGHIWPCGMMEHTIDDGFRARTGHCVSQAHMTGAVLDLAGIPHVLVQCSGGAKSHHFILSQDGAFLIDDGIPNFLGVDHYPSTVWGSLLSFAVGGEWGTTAATSAQGICSNVSAERMADLLSICETAVAGRFPLVFSLRSKTLSLEEFLEALLEEGDELQNARLP